MANITRIKASDPSQSKKGQSKTKQIAKTEQKSVKVPEKPEQGLREPVKAQKTAKADKKAAKKAAKMAKKAAKADKKPFVLFRPFVAFGRYIRNSWLELRQVRWPSRKATWKMVLAVFVYTAVFMAFLMLVDLLFEFVFTKLLG